MKKFNAAMGDPDPKIQARLVKTMEISYQSGVGELIRAMMTTHPNLAYASVNSHRPIHVRMNTISMASNTL
jgi:hypothetical protein